MALKYYKLAMVVILISFAFRLTVDQLQNCHYSDCGVLYAPFIAEHWNFHYKYYTDTCIYDLKLAQ